MRLLLVVTLIFALGMSQAASAQDIRTASPPVATIEISGFEPPPPGFPSLLFYGGRGGGGGDAIVPEGVHWDYTPGAMAGGGGSYFSACGFSQAPSALLVHPSGLRENLTPTRQSDNCVDYMIDWQYGMELGLYSLTLQGDEGSLEHTWGIDYPFCRTVIPYNEQAWMMGFNPNEQLTLIYYAFADAGEYRYVAQRSVRADSEGALLLDVQLARSAPFTLSELELAVLSSTRELYYPSESDGFDVSSFVDAGFVVETNPTPAATYTTYYTSNPFFADSRGISCDGSVSRFVQANPRTGDTIDLFADINSANTVGSLPAGAPAEILEVRPAMTNGRVAVWKHLLTEDGITGWSADHGFVTVSTRLIPGAVVEAIEVGEPDASGTLRAADPTMFTEPSNNAPAVGRIPVGTILTAYGYRQNGTESRWWYVVAEDGREGWMSEYDAGSYQTTISALPWQARNVNQPGAPWQTCPNSPPTRLITYADGRVMPGDSNNVRSAPESGDVVGQLPAGSRFSILDGPVCGTGSGLTWWYVQAGNLEGWTAEGQGSEYWLELMPFNPDFF